MTRRGAVPPGWDENPTAWPKRTRHIVLALGFVILCGAVVSVLPVIAQSLAALQHLERVRAKGGSDRRALWRTENRDA